MTSSEQLLNIAIEQLRSPVKTAGPPLLAPIPTPEERSEAFVQILHLVDAIPGAARPQRDPVHQFGELRL